MPALVLKKIPDDLHRKLKSQAELNRHSMTSQAILLLQQGVETHEPLNNIVVTLPPFKGKRPLTDALLAEAGNACP